MKSVKKIFLLFFLTSCANIVPPTGGDRDIDPPKILSINILENSKKTKSKVIKFEFDEYIQINKWEEYFYVSPPIKKRVKKKIDGEALFLTIEDELSENITYNFSLNSCIKDNNEGNVLDSLNYIFTKKNNVDTLSFSGNLKEAYSLSAVKNAWIMLFNEDTNDSLIFQSTPNYIAKTNENGNFCFPNLKNANYKIAALTGFDFIYNEDEYIAFADKLVSAKNDSFIALFSFNPIIVIDSANTEESLLEPDSSSIKDTIIKELLQTGTLKIKAKNTSCIFQLINEGKVITETYFNEEPYLIKEIIPGNYNIKYIADSNNDSVWNTGSWKKRIQPETVINYPSEITIRSNWDLELEWIIE